MFEAWQDHEIVGLISSILGIVLTLLKFFLGGKEENSEHPNKWKNFKKGTLIFGAGFLLGAGLCFYLFVNADWKVRKAFQRFSKQDTNKTEPQNKWPKRH